MKNKFFNIRCINWGSLLTRQTSSYGVSAVEERVIVLFNRNLPIRCHKTSLRAFVSWIADMALIDTRGHTSNPWNKCPRRGLMTTGVQIPIQKHYRSLGTEAPVLNLESNTIISNRNLAYIHRRIYSSVFS